MTFDANKVQAIAACVSAVADIATVGTAIATVRWIIQDRHKRRPELLAAWGELEDAYEPDVLWLRVYAVSLLAEPMTLTDVWAQNGLMLEAPHPPPKRAKHASNSTILTPPDPNSAPRIPTRDWVEHLMPDRLLTGHQPTGDYDPCFQIRVNVGKLRGPPTLKVRARLASDTRDSIEKILAVALPAAD